jgi:hypothetical protein
MHTIADASIPTLLPPRCLQPNPMQSIHATRASLIAAAQAMSWKTSQPEANTTPHSNTAQSTSGTRNYSTANALSGRRGLRKTQIVMLTSARRK